MPIFSQISPAPFQLNLQTFGHIRNFSHQFLPHFARHLRLLSKLRQLWSILIYQLIFILKLGLQLIKSGLCPIQMVWKSAVLVRSATVFVGLWWIPMLLLLISRTLFIVILRVRRLILNIRYFVSESINLRHVMLLQVSNFFIQTIDFHLLQVFLMIRINIFFISQTLYFLLHFLIFFPETLYFIIFRLKLILQALAHFFEFAYGNLHFW